MRWGVIFTRRGPTPYVSAGLRHARMPRDHITRIVVFSTILALLIIVSTL